MASNTMDAIGMLRKMILIREFDELAIKLRTSGKIYGTVHPYVGQEAVAVGVCANLQISGFPSRLNMKTPTCWPR